MDISTVRPEKTVFIIGAPRSGTTWLGKIFDSNPGVLYRHEPDTVLRDENLQRVFEADEYDAYREQAAVYIESLISARVLKASGTLPVFRKSFRSNIKHIFRMGLIVGLRATEKLTMDSHVVRRLLIPDMVDPAMADDVVLVIKSNISRGRVGLFASARPGSRFIFVMRDPFGQVASMLRGIQLGKFERVSRVDDCLDTPQARRYGITRPLFERLPPIEQHAWHWALFNEKTLDDLQAVEDKLVIRYRDLVDDPIARSKEMFAFAGLSYHQQTENFLRESTNSSVPDRYYQVYKNSLESLNKWRRLLTSEQQRQIVITVSDTVAWNMYPELHGELK